MISMVQISCDDESAAVPINGAWEYVFQYQTAKINDSDYQQNIDESSEKIVTCMLENTVQVGRLFDEKPVSRAVANIM